MFVTLLLASAAVLSGALFTYLFDDGASFPARVCSGVPIGFAGLAFAGFTAALALPFERVPLVSALLVSACATLLLARLRLRTVVYADIAKSARDLRAVILHPTPAAVTGFGFYVLISLLLCLAFNRVFFVKADGLYTGFVNNLGDLPFHLQIITSFVYGHNLVFDDPTYTGSRFTYPFLADLVAAVFVRAGASLRQALFVENVLLSLSLVGVLYRCTWEMTKDRIAALLSPFLVLFNGGFGWWLFCKDAVRNPAGLLVSLAHPPRDYTIVNGTDWRWGNALTSLLTTQRSLLFGLPLAVVIFTQLWLALKEQPATETLSAMRTPVRRMIAAGVLTGFLPLIHTHTWMVVLAMGVCLALIFRQAYNWAIFFTAALAISGLQIWWMMHSSSIHLGTFLGWHFGWDKGEGNAIWFWAKNTGLFIPLLVAAVLWRGKEYLVPPRLLRFYMPFVLCFLLPNAVKLAPWIWDNIKVLFYWYVASVPLVALLLARLLRGRSYARALGTVLLLSLTLAGGLDLWRVISRTTEYKEFDREGMTVAEMILQQTEPRALILHASVFNSPVYLTGRRSLLGYTGWIWSRGMDYGPRAKAIEEIYAGSTPASALMQSYAVDYVLIGPAERLNMPVADNFFSQYRKIVDSGDYRLYRVGKP